jgi:hypothetical protein
MQTVATRLLICIQMICVALFAPILPVQAEKPAIKKTHCSAEVLASAGKCHGCPSDADTQDSNTRSTCCFNQHCCVVLYLTNARPFVANILVLGTVNGIDEHASTRVHRPPVPPPRFAAV